MNPALSSVMLTHAATVTLLPDVPTFSRPIDSFGMRR